MEKSQMPLIEHLGELRKRIIIALVSLFLMFVVTFNFSEDIFKFVTFPLKYDLAFSWNSPYINIISHAKLPSNAKLVFLSPAEALWMNMKVAFFAALLLSMPVIFSQVWKFISPGLLAREKKYVLPFVITASGLFVLGAAFCFFIVLPFALGFLLTYKIGDVLMPMLSVGEYVDFCLKFVLAFGAIFELPIVMLFSTRMGLVTPQFLARKRKYAVLLSFVAAAILTPTPDMFNQFLMAFPMIIFYEIGILISRIFSRKRTQNAG